MESITGLIIYSTIIAFGVWLFWINWRRDKFASEIVNGCCRNCGYDLRYSKKRCPECGELIPRRSSDYFPLRDEWPTAPITPRTPSAEETPVVIRSTVIAAEAQLIQDQLNARGIACWIDRHEPYQLIGYPSNWPAESNLAVWSADEAVARELLDRLMRYREKNAECKVQNAE